MATRFYYEANNAPPVSPAFDGGWQSTAEAVRRNAALAKSAATETLSGSLGGAAGDNDLVCQIVSLPLNGDQTISGSWTHVLRARELAANDNINQRRWALKVVSNDGTTVRGTLRAFGTSGSTSEYGTSFTGILMATLGALTTVNALDGDRIVIETGVGESASGTSPSWEAVLGGDGTDHAASNGDTTGTVGWVELSATLSFQVSANAEDGFGTGTASDALASVGADAEAAAGTGTAFDATVSTSSGTSAAAEAAEGTGAAADAAAAITADAGAATVTGSADTAAASVGALSGSASAAGGADNASVSATVPADVAPAVGSADNATIDTGAQAPAEAATGAGSAFDATVAVQVAASAATGTSSALDAVAQIGIEALAELASALAEAAQATGALGAQPESSTAAGSSLNITATVGGPTVRPFTGTTSRPSTGTTTRPFTGTTTRP